MVQGLGISELLPNSCWPEIGQVTTEDCTADGQNKSDPAEKAVFKPDVPLSMPGLK